jgi:hypothetical protein
MVVQNAMKNVNDPLKRREQRLAERITPEKVI